MKKIYSISILIFILIFGLLCVSNKQIVRAGKKPCTISKAVGHEDGCDDYCKALKDGNYNKDDEDVTDIICSTCGNSRTWKKDGRTYSNFKTMYGGCCLSYTPKTPCDYAVNYCDYKYTRYNYGTCSKTIKTQSVVDSQGNCVDWYLPSTYLIKNLPMMESVKSSTYGGNSEVFKLWEPFILSNSNSNIIKPLEQTSENYTKTLEAYLAANGLQICTSDRDCTRCPDDNPECLICEEGKTNPYYRCFSNTKQCILFQGCGIDECGYKITIDGKDYIKECCSEADFFPHKECKTITENNVTYHTCVVVPTCGMTKCDTTLNKEEYSSVLKKKITTNEKCTLMAPTTSSTASTTTSSTIPGQDRYICNPQSSYNYLGYYQCIVDNTNTYPEAKWCNPDHNTLKLIDRVNPYVKPKEGFTPLRPITYNPDCDIVKPPPAPPVPETIFCYINNLKLHNDKTNTDYYDYYYISPKPEGGILKNPTLQYSAVYCSACTLSISPDNPEFIKDNQLGVLSGKLLDGFTNRYVFDRSWLNIEKEPLVLNVNSLDKNTIYTLTLTCTDPDTKDIQTEEMTIRTWLGIRWREVVPIIPNGRGR